MRGTIPVVRRIGCASFVAVALACAVVRLNADDSTAALVTAVRVHHELIVNLRTVGDTKSFEYSVEGPSAFEDLTVGRTFSSSGRVTFVYPALNPLELQVSASASQVADPNQAQLAGFVDKLLSFPKVLGAPETPAPSCEGLDAFLETIVDLRKQLLIGSEAGDRLEKWKTLVGAKPGAAGVADARSSASSYATDLKKAYRTATADLAKINAVIAENASLATVFPTVPAPPPPNTVKSPPAEEKPQAPSTGSAATTTPAKPGAAAKIGGRNDSAAAAGKRAATKAAPAPKPPETPQPPVPAPAPATSCGSPDALARALASVIGLTNPEDQLNALQQVAESVDAIVKSLAPYADSGNWSPNGYRFFETTPVADKITNVTISVAPLKPKATPVSLTLAAGEAKTVTLALRKYSTFVPEVAAGFVVSGVRKASYGTGKAADGTTVVALTERKDVSYAGAALLNGVCRCGMESFAYPMLQLGVSTDGTNPGVLFGGGFRFTNPKAVAISFGAILAWVDDLTDLHVGSPVTGTADITKDLTKHRQIRPYMTIQYHF